MKILELFSGNKSISKVFKQKDPSWEVVSLDFVQSLNPDICIDILQWDYKVYPEGHFDVIWASPDCRSWSVAGHGQHRKLPTLEPLTETAVIGEQLVHKTLEIINYFRPKIWFIENPRGLMRHFPPMKALPHRHLVYYSNHDYPMTKPTDIWSNIRLFDDEKDPKVVFPKNKWGHNIVFSTQKKNRSLIPSKLVEKIYDLAIPLLV